MLIYSLVNLWLKYNQNHTETLAQLESCAFPCFMAQKECIAQTVTETMKSHEISNSTAIALFDMKETLKKLKKHSEITNCLLQIITN